MNRELVIDKVKTKISEDLSFEKIINSTIDEYTTTVIGLFNYINHYKDEYALNCYDFRGFLNELYKNLDLKNDFEENRYTLIIGELAIHYTNEPYFWNSSFEIFLIKLHKFISYLK